MAARMTKNGNRRLAVALEIQGLRANAAMNVNR